jgi:DNA-binding transcriptional ArsR family regulator
MPHPVDAQIHELHRQLAGLPQAEPETRDQLLILLADITRLLDDAASAQHTPTEAVESLAARFDADHPALSGALRNLIDSLGKAGI